MSSYPERKLWSLKYNSSKFEVDLALALEYFSSLAFTLRNNHDLSQRNLAKLLHMDVSQICIIENRPIDFRVSTLIKYSTLFNLEPDILLPSKKSLHHFLINKPDYIKDIFYRKYNRTID